MYFHITLITESQMHKRLTNLDVSKATGFDKNLTRLLKVSVDVISNCLTYLINYSFQQGFFLYRWKVNPL